MGSVESIPVSDQDLARPHQVDRDVPLVTTTIAPLHQPQVLFMPQNFSSWKGDRHFGVVLPNGSSFHGVYVSGHQSSSRCKFAVWDSNNRLLVVCLLMYTGGTLYKIYVPQAVFPGQIPSKQEYNGVQLFTYAQVSEKQVTLSNENGPANSGTTPEFTVHGTKLRRVLKHDGAIAAVIEFVSEKWGRNRRRKISMCPGIDPILLLCFGGMCEWSSDL